MSFKLGILGGALQGVEAASLARWAGWNTILLDARPKPPAKDLAGRFVSKEVLSFSDLDKGFSACDLVIPACEDLPTLKLMTQWSKASGQPLAFDLDAYLISTDKKLSKNLFYEKEIPTAKPYPGAAFPLIAKPRSASGSKGVCIIKDEKSLEELFPDFIPEDWLLEEYCPGPSYSIEVSGTPQAYTTWLPTYLQMDEIYDCSQVIAPAGLSEHSEGVFREIALNIAKALQFKGLIDVEVILTPSGFKVLEIDARLPSQTPTTVYWSTGENLLHSLANIFSEVSFLPSFKEASLHRNALDSQASEPESEIISSSPLKPKAPKQVIYEHVLVKNKEAFLCGEHVMAKAAPLWLHEDFFGADWALSDYKRGASQWAATLIILAESFEELQEKRASVWHRIKEFF